MILNYDHEPFIVQANDPNVSISPPSAKKTHGHIKADPGNSLPKGT